jgi:hypothetical protein
MEHIKDVTNVNIIVVPVLFNLYIIYSSYRNGFNNTRDIYGSTIVLVIIKQDFVSFHFISQSLLLLSTHSRCRSCLLSLVHTQTHTIVGRTPLDEGSARRRDLYLTTHEHSQDTNIHAPGGIRTHDPSMRSAADPSLRPRRRWDQLNKISST